MRVGLCYESVLPARGGCEHYISDLARRLARDGHEVHLFACRWDAAALPSSTVYHALPMPKGPRFLRPWRFAKSCLDALKANTVDVSIGFDKTYGQDVLYPQGGLHSASREHNLRKHASSIARLGVRVIRLFDPATYSFRNLERRQYLTEPRPRILAISRMVQRHFVEHLGIDDTTILRAAIDPDRFAAADRDALRRQTRSEWDINDEHVLGLFVGMNYRLKGLEPLLRALPLLPSNSPFRLAVVGGAKFDRYKALATSLGVSDRVRFLGFKADPKDAYFAADFLVHPTFYDPCSLVALEALACGLPVLTTQFNGAGELLSPHNGLIVRDPHEAKELATAIADMADPEKLSARKAAAAVAGSRWTFDVHYAKLLLILHEAARPQPVPAP